MRGCKADVLQALLQGKQLLLIDEDSRLAAASVVGIGTSPTPSPPPLPHAPPPGNSPPNYWRATVNIIPGNADPAGSCRVTLTKSPLGLLKSTYAVRH